MPGKRVTRVLCAGNPEGSATVERLLETGRDRDVDALALIGNLGGGGDRAESYRQLFRTVGESGLPAYWVPGPEDAPVSEYLREAQNMEVVFPLLHGVHGTAAFASEHVIFAGLGGEISDDPDAPREELERLAYPRWEPEYHLKLLRELDEHQIVLLFATPPAHKGRGSGGSEVLAELIATHRARVAICGGERGTAMLGRTLVVSPGNLGDGEYAIVDLHAREAELESFAATAG